MLSQVENQVFHPLRLQLLQRLAELGKRLLGKPFQLDVAGLLVHHEVGFHAMDGDFVPRDGEMERLLLPAPADVDRDTGPLFAAQLLEDPGVGADFPDRHAVIDADDLVTGADANPFGGAALDRLHHHDGVLHDLELHADAVEIALQRLVHAAHLLFGHIDRMRVKLFQHLHNGLVGQFLKIGRIHIIVADVLHQPVHLLRMELVVAVALGRHGPYQQQAGRHSRATMNDLL